MNDELALNFDYHDSSAETGANSPNGTSSLITMASFNKVGQTIITGSEMPIMVLNLNSGGEENRPLYANDMIITGSVFRNDASEMNIEQATMSGTWDFADNASIDFGVQMSDVDNRSVSNFIQLNNWGVAQTPVILLILSLDQVLQVNLINCQEVTILIFKLNISLPRSLI